MQNTGYAYMCMLYWNIFWDITTQYVATVYTWLNAMAFISLVRILMQRLFKSDHYSILQDVIYTHNF